jgi:hypothetical protein
MYWYSMDQNLPECRDNLALVQGQNAPRLKPPAGVHEAGPAVREVEALTDGIECYTFVVWLESSRPFG